MPVNVLRPGLTRSRVLAAAVALADSQGIDALTLRRLSDALQVHPSSIYNHLAGKDEILDGVAEQLMSEAALPARVDSWQDWVHGFAAAMRRVARAHPGAFAVLSRRPARGADVDAHVEAALSAFAADGFSPAQASAAVTGTALAVMGLALNDAPGPGPAPRAGPAHLRPERFPRMAEAGATAPATSDPMWELMVAAIVTGLEAAAR